MTTPRDPDSILAGWLDEGPTRLPETTRRAIQVAIGTSQQKRRRTWLPWRTSSMNGYARAIAAIAIVALVGFAGLTFFRGSSGPGGVGPSPAPPASIPPSSTASPSSSPSIAPSPTASPISTADWVPFTSTRYGYEIKIPPFWATAQSTRQWSLAVDQYDWLTSAADSFGSDPHVTVFAVDVPAGTSNDAWIASYYGPDAKGSPDPCQHRPVDLGTKEIDGHPVAFWNEVAAGQCEGTYAFVFVGSRVHVFYIGRAGQEPLFEALMSTVTFRP